MQMFVQRDMYTIRYLVSFEIHFVMYAFNVQLNSTFNPYKSTLNLLNLKVH